MRRHLAWNIPLIDKIPTILKTVKRNTSRKITFRRLSIDFVRDSIIFFNPGSCEIVRKGRRTLTILREDTLGIHGNKLKILGGLKFS